MLDTRHAAGRLFSQVPDPTDLSDGVESLSYWRSRRRALPWWEVRARREATRSVIAWEQRLGRALMTPNSAPLATRLAAGAVVAQTRLGRWARRAVAAVLATVAASAIVTTALIVLLVHAL